MNSKYISISIGLFVALASTIGEVNSQKHDLALLHTQLLNLSYPKKAAAGEEFAPHKDTPGEEKKGKEAEAEMKAGEPHLIDFESPAIKQLVLTAAYNTKVPDQVPLKIGNVTVVQLFVAWQDLQALVFVTPPTKDVGILKNERYTPEGIQNLIRLLQNENAPLLEKLGKNKSKVNPAAYLGGGTVSCGYHAVKNILLTTNLIYGTNQERTNAAHGLVDLDLTNSLFGSSIQNTLINGKNSPGIWRAYIVAHPTVQVKMYGATLTENTYDFEVLDKAKKGDWLTTFGIQDLWDNYDASAPTMQEQIKQVVGETLLGQTLEQIRALYKNKNKLQLPLIIALNYTAEQRQQFQKSPDAQLALVLHVDGNHWISLVLNKINGATQCIILDSKNFPRYYDATVIEFIKQFTGATIPPMAERKKTDAEIKAEDEAILNHNKALIRNYILDVKDKLAEELKALKITVDALPAQVELAFGAGILKYAKDAFDATKEDIEAVKQRVIKELTPVPAKKGPEEKKKDEEKKDDVNQKALDEYKKLMKKLNEDLEGLTGKRHPTQKRKKLIDEFFGKDENKKMFAVFQWDFEGTKAELYKKYNIT